MEHFKEAAQVLGSSHGDHLEVAQVLGSSHKEHLKEVARVLGSSHGDHLKEVARVLGSSQGGCLSTRFIKWRTSQEGRQNTRLRDGSLQQELLRKNFHLTSPQRKYLFYIAIKSIGNTFLDIKSSRAETLSPAPLVTVFYMCLYLCRLR